MIGNSKGLSSNDGCRLHGWFRRYYGKEFTDRLFADRSRAPSGDHEFDQLCTALGIKHRLTRVRRPQTNGMVERFNGRIADILRTHRFDSRSDLESTLKRYVWLYNHHLPQKALEHRTPIQAMKDWAQSHPALFRRAVRNHPGPDTYGYRDQEYFFLKIQAAFPGNPR